MKIVSFTAALVAILIADVGPVFAGDRPITALVPADCLVVYSAKPYKLLAPPATQPTDSQPTSTPSLSSVAYIISFLSGSGLLPDEGQVFADIATALPLLGRFEHALVLLDVASKPVESPDSKDMDPSLRLERLQTAVIFRTEGRHGPILEQLNRVVKRYTNMDVAKLTNESVAGLPYQRLSDSRLIGWAVWEWGRLDEFYVVSFGQGAFERIAKTFTRQTPSLSQDAWFQSAMRQIKGDQAIAECFVAFSRLKEALGAVTQGRVAQVTAALEADGMTHDLWTIGREGRALTWFRCSHQGSKDIVRGYSDPARYSAQHRRIIPDEAEHVAVIYVPTRWLVDKLPRAWLCAQSEGNAEKWRRIWERLEQETGLDINGNLISHLGENVVLFDYPPHPLRIPFALTFAIDINDRKPVAVATNALLEAWSRYLDERAERNQTTLVRLKVRKSDDGIWFLQAGILGPALKVTDHYLVISWSPEALREALRFIEGPEMKASAP